MDSITFLASFPAIQSAIKIHGSGDGMRIQFDVPESEMKNAIKLWTWRERVLRITIEPEPRNERPWVLSTDVTGGEPRLIE